MLAILTAPSGPFEVFLRVGDILLPQIYLLCWGAYALDFFRDDEPAGRWATRLLVIGVIAHSVILVTRSFQDGHFPLANVAEATMTLSLACALAYLYVEWRIRERSVGMFSMPLVYGFQLIASVMDSRVVLVDDALKGGLFAVHTMGAILGYAALAIAAVTSIVYLMLYHQIKHRRFGLIYRRLPPLATLSAMTFRSVLLGFVCLTISLVVGALLIREVLTETPSLLDPKIVIGFATWALYGVALGASRAFGWGSRRFALFSLVGFVSIVFSLLVVNALFRTFHDFL